MNMNENFTYPQPKITVESATEADLKEALMGSPTDPTYEQQFGITSAPLGSTGYKPPSMAELEMEAHKAMAKVAAEAAATQGAPDIFTDDEATQYKKLYGQSENEKGELRKSQKELMEAFEGLMAQYQELSSNNVQVPVQQNFQAQPQFAPQPQYARDPFEGIGDEDVLQGKQLKQLVDREIRPAFQALFQQTQAAEQRSAALEGQLLKQLKTASGVSPMDEFRITGKNPWLKGLPPAQRLQAIAGLRQSELAQERSAPAPVAPPVQTEAQQRILNKITYVEGSKPVVQDSTEAAIEAAKDRDYAKVMAAPLDTGERAKLFRLWAHKYGINTIGTPPSDIAH